MGEAREATARPVLSPSLRRNAASWCRPVDFGFPGRVIGELLDHIEAVERWEAERKRDMGAIREYLMQTVAAHMKAAERLFD